MASSVDENIDEQKIQEKKDLEVARENQKNEELKKDDLENSFIQKKEDEKKDILNKSDELKRDLDKKDFLKKQDELKTTLQKSVYDDHKKNSEDVKPEAAENKYKTGKELQEQLDLERQTIFASEEQKIVEQFDKDFPKEKKTDVLESYREAGLIRGAEHTGRIGKDYSEQITINENEFQQRQQQLDSKMQDLSASPEARERAQLQKEAEYHSYRAEQWTRINQFQSMCDGMNGTKTDNGKYQEIQREHQQSANVAAEKLYQFDKKHNIVNDISESVSKSNKKDSEFNLTPEQEKAANAAEAAFERVKSRNANSSLSSSENLQEENNRKIRV